VRLEVVVVHFAVVVVVFDVVPAVKHISRPLQSIFQPSI
jgi:hypothetical protein